MSKKNSISLFSYLTLSIFIVLISLNLATTYLESLKPLNILISSFVIFTVSFIVYLISFKFKWITDLSFILNMIAIGIALSAYYIFLNKELLIRDLIISGIATFIIVLLFHLIYKLKIANKFKKIYSVLSIAGLVVVYLHLFSIFPSFTEIYLFMLFLSFMYFFIIIKKISNNDSIIKIIIPYSFGLFIIIFVIVFAIISEGDVSDLFDASLFGGNNKKNKKENLLK